MNSIVRVQLVDEEIPTVDHPVRVSARRFEQWQERSKGKLLCLHDWQPRLSLSVGELEIHHWDVIEVCNFPAGRFCSKCGKVDFSHSEGATEKWKSRDFPV
ncbi:MAG: hypothetical protein WC433_08145 [Candidatus Omnitrophota bacterium]